MVSIEPIIYFDLGIMVAWMKNIKPEFVYVGYDNYNHRLPEPSLAQTEELMYELDKFTVIHRKTLRKAWWE
jgi:hypothetical protein